MSKRAFFCWQSDHPVADVKDFILNSLLAAVATSQWTLEWAAETWTLEDAFARIRVADLVVVDLTSIASVYSASPATEMYLKEVPNPNVMLELGYAIATVGYDRMLGVRDVGYGRGDLPILARVFPTIDYLGAKFSTTFPGEFLRLEFIKRLGAFADQASRAPL